MATLKSKHQRFIVTRLARYDKPVEVQAALKDRFGLDVETGQVVYYNPETQNGGRALAKQWRKLFYATRKSYREDTSAIAASSKAHRIRMLEEAAEQYRRDGAYVLMADMLEQIAKETGGQYTNRHLLEHAGKGGGPIQTAQVSIEEWREQQSERIEKTEKLLERFSAGSVDELEAIGDAQGAGS
jgi:hypothetical protein